LHSPRADTGALTAMAEDRGAFKTNPVNCDRHRQIVMFHQWRCREASRTQKRMLARPAAFGPPIL
jgi:hypothetical protein